jgi:hypothetical protein
MAFRLTRNREKVIHMNSTYHAGVMSIAAAHTGAALSDRLAQLCVQRADAGELGWQPYALTNSEALIVPLEDRQGTGVSSASTTFTRAATKLGSFQGQSGPQVSLSTG